MNHLLHRLLPSCALVIPVVAGLAGATSPPALAADAFSRVLTDVAEQAAPVCPPRGLCVVTFADKDGADRLTSWMSAAGTTVARTWPAEPVRYVSIADVSAVPSLLRGLVGRLLARMDHNNQASLRAQYADIGVDLERQGTTFSLIPDCDGALRTALAVGDQSGYRIWIVLDRRLVAVRTEHDASSDAAWYLQTLQRLLNAATRVRTTAIDRQEVQ